MYHAHYWLWINKSRALVIAAISHPVHWVILSITDFLLTNIRKSICVQPLPPPLSPSAAIKNTSLRWCHRRGKATAPASVQAFVWDKDTRTEVVYVSIIYSAIIVQQKINKHTNNRHHIKTTPHTHYISRWVRGVRQQQHILKKHTHILF